MAGPCREPAQLPEGAVIRPAQPTDVPGLADVIRSIGYLGSVVDQERAQTLTLVLHQLESCLANQDHTVYLAQDSSGEIVGYCSVHWNPYLFHTGPDGYISELFIKDTARGNGFGTALLEAIKAEAERRGCQRLFLLNIRTRESYQRHFYAGCGWEEWTDAAVFLYRLDPPQKES